MYSIKRSNGKIRGERIRVKTFKDSNAMFEFLNKQSDNTWRINEQLGIFKTLPHKNGNYAYAGGQWHNVKTLDPSALNHI